MIPPFAPRKQLQREWPKTWAEADYERGLYREYHTKAELEHDEYNDDPFWLAIGPICWMGHYLCDLTWIGRELSL